MAIKIVRNDQGNCIKSDFVFIFTGPINPDEINASPFFKYITKTQLIELGHLQVLKYKLLFV